jgi:SAM-dependent methyltransferase
MSGNTHKVATASDHDSRLLKECEWYDAQQLKPHVFNRWPLSSKLRNHLAYEVARQNLTAKTATIHAECRDVLIAPCGLGGDAIAFQAIWPNSKITGLDISPKAVERCQIRDARVGDILHMPFADCCFDAVISTLFFHHIADEGFRPYLLEIARVLRPGGIMVTMEQNKYHPLFFLTRPLKAIVGNITAQVEHEHPIRISELSAVAKESGFCRVETFACSFGHNRMPIPLTCLLNVFCYIPLFKNLSWLMGVVAKKSE